MDSFSLYLFIFALGAFFVPIFHRWIFIPSVVGEILYGMALQGFLPEAPDDLYLIDFLAQMGFIFLMFLAGFEINFDFFTREKIVYAAGAVVSLFVLSWLSWEILGRPNGIFYILILSALSVGIPFIILKTAHREKSDIGQNLILVASAGELISILGMILLEVYMHSGKASIVELAENLSGIFLLILGAYVLIRLIMLFFWWFPESVAGLYTEGDTSELSVRLSFLLLLTMVAMSAYFHLELILGAFIAGMIISYVFRNQPELEKKLSSIGYGFFIPFFFIKIGWDFHFASETFETSLVAALGLFGLIWGLRVLVSLGFIPRLKKQGISKTIRNLFAIAFLLAAPLTMLVAIGKLGYSLKLINEVTYNGIILCAMLGGITGVGGYRLLYRD